jgi:hypothetical protein
MGRALYETTEDQLRAPNPSIALGNFGVPADIVLPLEPIRLRG